MVPLGRPQATAPHLPRELGTSQQGRVPGASAGVELAEAPLRVPPSQSGTLEPSWCEDTLLSRDPERGVLLFIQGVFPSWDLLWPRDRCGCWDSAADGREPLLPHLLPRRVQAGNTACPPPCPAWRKRAAGAAPFGPGDPLSVRLQLPSPQRKRWGTARAGDLPGVGGGRWHEDPAPKPSAMQPRSREERSDPHNERRE